MAGADGMYVYLGVHFSEQAALDDCGVLRDRQLAEGFDPYEAAVITRGEDGHVRLVGVGGDRRHRQYRRWAGIPVDGVIRLIFPPSAIGSAGLDRGSATAANWAQGSPVAQQLVAFNHLLDNGQSALVVVGSPTIESALQRSGLRAVRWLAQPIGVGARGPDPESRTSGGPSAGRATAHRQAGSVDTVAVEAGPRRRSPAPWGGTSGWWRLSMVGVLWTALALTAALVGSPAVGAASSTPSPAPTAVAPRAVANTAPAWLAEVNRYRQAAGLAPVTDQPGWDAGILDHLTYLEHTPSGLFTGAYQSAHTENPASPYYTASGAHEGGKSDLLQGGGGETDVQMIDAWLTSPFHATAILNPTLGQVAFASLAGDAGLDVGSGYGMHPAATGPVLFPGNDMVTNLTAYQGYESPSPLGTCGWQSLPSAGLPLIAQLTADPSPNLTATLRASDGSVESSAAANLCIVDDHTYVSSDPVYGPTGLQILTGDRAVYLIPKAPLADGTYTASIQQPGQATVTWSFAVVTQPSIVSTLLPAGTVGDSYSSALAGSGGRAPYAWSITSGTLPAGLALDPSSGVITGTPITQGVFSFQATVRDANGSVDVEPVTLVVFPVDSWPVQPSPAAPPPLAGGIPAPVVSMAPTPSGDGYWLADAEGWVSAHGAAQSFGSMAGQHLNAPITHIISTADGRGYWLVAADGGTFSFGDAGFYGSMGGRHLNAPVVDIAPTVDGRGYWLVASDGGIFAFGDAPFHGSMGGSHLNRPVVGISADAQTGGYWEVATDGGVFAFDAPFYGSTGSKALNRPVNSMAPAPDGRGYWFVASDGGIFAFGDARFCGSTGATRLNAPIVGMASDSATGGYWLVASDGGVFSFNAPFYGAD